MCRMLISSCVTIATRLTFVSIPSTYFRALTIDRVRHSFRVTIPNIGGCAYKAILPSTLFLFERIGRLQLAFQRLPTTFHYLYP